MYLAIDSTIKNWVFIPITIITISINLLMKYLNVLVNKNNNKANLKESTQKGDFEFKSEISNRDVDIKIKNAINRCNKLRQNYMTISERGFKLRKAFFSKEGDGFFCQKIEAKAAEIMNPNMMGDMLKKNLLNGLYYTLIFVGVGYFFTGFILLKLPFGVTQKFRSMLQQGLNLPDLDISYVSAVSWCFILVFGLNSILQHFDGPDNFSMLQEQEKMMKAPMSMGFGGPEAKDYDKILSTEKENLDIIPFYSQLEDSIDKLIEKYEHLL